MEHIGCEHAIKTWLHEDEKTLHSFYIKHMGWYGGFTINAEYIDSFLGFGFSAPQIINLRLPNDRTYAIELSLSAIENIKRYIIEQTKIYLKPAQKDYEGWLT